MHPYWYCPHCGRVQLGDSKCECKKAQEESHEN